MKEISLSALLAISQQLLGWMFWPVIGLGVLCLLNLLWILISDRRIAINEFMFSMLLGILGGFGAIWFVLDLTSSTVNDLSETVDWATAGAIWLGTMLAGTIVAYTVLRPLRMGR